MHFLKIAGVAVQTTNWDNYDLKGLANLESQGITFVESNTAVFQKSAQSVYKKFEKESPEMVELVIET